jgi:hypothetical protein
MKRDLEWIEKLDDGVKRTVRIAIQKGKITWQFKLSNMRLWDHTTPPTPADWAKLEAKIDQLYYRRRAGYQELEFVRLMKKKYTPVSVPTDAEEEISV